MKAVNSLSQRIISLPIVAVVALSVICFVLILVRAVRLQEDQYGFLLWNLFLAWLPLIVSSIAVLFARHASGPIRLPGLVALGIVWLLLFPNAPYLTTDFIHLILDRTFQRYDDVGLLLWFDLIVMFLFAWCGLLLGYLSMRHFHKLVSKMFHGAAGWLFIVAASFLSGFGVYLGRVVRLNSWDAVSSPFRLIEGVLEGLNRDSAAFTFLFGNFILVIYLSLYVLQGDKWR